MAVVLCIDLEATCFENCTVKDMEIIEIGVIAIDDDGNEIDRFASLVKPFFTLPTEFSYQINQINRSMVAKADTFPEMIIELQQWLNKLPEEPVNWYSWGSYDCRQWEQDLLRFGLEDPLPEHINAKKLFQKKMTPGAKQVGLKKALEIVGLEFEGRLHSAEYDAYNLSRVIASGGRSEFCVRF